MEDITQEIRGDVIINRVNLLRATVNEAAELKNILQEHIVFGYFKIVVDLSQCTHLDSTFIGVLVVIHKELLAKGGDLKLVDPLDPAKELFCLTGISKVINTFEVAEDAVKSFGNSFKQVKTKTADDNHRNNVDWSFA